MVIHVVAWIVLEFLYFKGWLGFRCIYILYFVYPFIYWWTFGLFPSFSSVQFLSRVWLSATPWTTAHQACLSITNSWSLLKLMSIELVMPSNHLILCCPPFCIIFYNFLKTQSFIVLRCPFTEQSPFASSTDLGWLPSRVTQILTPESLNLWVFCLARLHV